MASTTVVNVKVEELTKYGFKMNGKYVNYSKQFKDQAKVVPGATFEAEFYVADSGKEYLNKILSKPGTTVVNSPVTDVNPPVDHERAKRFSPKFQKKAAPDNAMSKEEWAAKDQRISRQGVIQAAVIALAPVVSLEKLPAEAIKLATAMLAFVNPEA